MVAADCSLGVRDSASRGGDTQPMGRPEPYLATGQYPTRKWAWVELNYRPHAYQEDEFRDRIQEIPRISRGFPTVYSESGMSFSAPNGTGKGTKAWKYPPIYPPDAGP